MLLGFFPIDTKLCHGLRVQFEGFGLNLKGARSDRRGGVVISYFQQPATHLPLPSNSIVCSPIARCVVALIRTAVRETWACRQHFFMRGGW